MMSFEEAFKRLNEAQKDAVESIYGPTMVIAWPWTWKTQIISLRTANIISKTDVSPGNILITTFTEAWVIAIRKRLADFIWSDSYKVNVCTIHSFCNDVIQMFPEKFLKFRALRPIDEIEALEILEQVIDWGDFKALRSDYDKYFYIRSIKDRISKLKQEWIMPGDFAPIIDLQRRKYDEELSLVDPKLKKYTLLKEKQERHILKLEELDIMYRDYSEKCQKMWVYDFSDMIDFVLKTFKEDEDLRYFFAEKYQFVMVDEYQDTNNAQNSIIDLMMQVSDNRNILVVWDDDQSIYRFQWANLENMLQFPSKYPDTKFVVLTENYRSTQKILDLATKSISFSSSRIVDHIESLDKTLNSNNSFVSEPELFSLSSDLEEKSLLLLKIKEFEDAWIPKEEIAIIVRTNKEVKEYSDLLRSNWIEIQSKSSSNILESKFTKLLISLVRMVADPYSSDTELADLLRSGLWDISRVDVIRVLRKLSTVNYTKKQKVKIFDFLLDSEMLDSLVQKNDENNNQQTLFSDSIKWWLRDFSADWFRQMIDAIKDCQEMLESWFYSFFKFCIDRVAYLDFVSANWNFSDLQDLYTLLEVIKTWNESDKNFNVQSFLKKLSYYLKYSIEIQRWSYGSKAAWVNIMTAHQSKWLEYEAVIIPGLVLGNWWSRRVVDHLSLPYSVIWWTLAEQITKDESEDEERRLFFVALTRAKTRLTLTFPCAVSQKLKIQSQFVQELGLDTIVPTDIDTESVIMNEMKAPFLSQKLDNEEELYITEFLKKYKLSPSDLNKFIEDPKMFLRDVIFKYPFEDNEFTIFWKVYHKTLEYFYLEYKNTWVPPWEKFLESRFKYLLSKEILTPEEQGRLENKGIQWLYWWYLNNVSTFNLPLELEYDFRPRWIILDWVPLTWKIDKIELIWDDKVSLVDYKTGRPKSENELLWKTQWSDWKYYRQLLFYKIMFDLDNALSTKYEVSDLKIEFVEWKDSKYPAYSLPFSKDDVDSVKVLIADCWSKISDLWFWRDLL